MTEAEQFAAVDAFEGETMIVFSDRALADRFMLHQAAKRLHGLVALVEDTRECTGLCVMWRDPVPLAKLSERLANCRWLLEETLAGRSPWPESGQVQSFGKVGGQKGKSE